MKLIGCQLDIVWENRPANFKRVSALLNSTQVPAGSLVVLPELFACGFTMNVPAAVEKVPSETEAFLADLARQHRSWVLGGIATQTADGRGRNQAAVFSPEGREIARYTKMQPFNLGGEGRHYTEGEQIVTVPVGGFAVAPFVCYDLRFPELFRAAVRAGTQLFAVIANWPIKRIHHWVTLLQARAIENQAYVIGVNRCGTDPQHTYNGRSLIVNPHGDILADAGNGEGVISADADLQVVLDWRRDFPALQDMR